MQADLAALLLKANVCASFIKFLTDNEISTIGDLVWAAGNKADRVDEELISASGIIGLTLREKISIRKAWYDASLSMSEAQERKAAPAAGADQPISIDDTRTLQDEFARRHAFKLGSKRLLSELLQGQILREFNRAPKSFKLVLPDKLLLLNVVGTAVGTTVTYVNGQQPSTTEIILDGVGDTIGLWIRLRALMNTLAYASIQRPQWFSYGDAEEFSDQLLTWMNTKYDGKRMTLQYYQQAYIATFQMFFEDIRLNDVSLSSLVKNQSSFRSFWTSSNGPPASSKEVPVMSPPPAIRSGNPSTPDTNLELIREMAKLRSMNDRLSSKVDSLQAHGRQSNGAGGGGDRGKGGGGGFNGGGGGKSKFKTNGNKGNGKHNQDSNRRHDDNYERRERGRGGDRR